MGLSTDLANAAKKLRRNIDAGVEVKRAVRVFAKDVEKAAETVKKATRALLNVLPPSDD